MHRRTLTLIASLALTLSAAYLTLSLAPLAAADGPGGPIVRSGNVRKDCLLSDLYDGPQLHYDPYLREISFSGYWVMSCTKPNMTDPCKSCLILHLYYWDEAQNDWQWDGDSSFPVTVGCGQGGSGFVPSVSGVKMTTGVGVSWRVVYEAYLGGCPHDLDAPLLYSDQAGITSY
jgi:hypothetical protein